MTLLETERLIRKISDLLKQAGNPAIAPKLAEDFAAACHATDLRLQQCEAMIKAGDHHQAIQLAEMAPNLLDLVTALEFRGSDEWREYCRQNGLPVPDRIDARPVQALNECYAKGITTDHPLYAVYRRAALGRKDEDALKALQSITRLNPTDANASSEIARLDAKVLAARMQRLRELLHEADPSKLVEEIEAIETFGFKSRLEGTIWQAAQTIRCGWLLEEAGKLKEAGRWMDAMAKLDLVHRLYDDLKLEFSSAITKQLEALDAWAHSEQEKARKEQEFRSLLAELQYRIQQNEEKDTSARYVKLPEMRDDYEALHKVWRSLTDFTRTIPEELTASFRKRSGLLEGEIARRTAIRRNVIIASSVAVLLVGGLLVWVVLGQMKSRNLARQLQEVVTQRQVHTAEKLLERARMERAGSLSALVAAAETFVSKESGLLKNFDSAFNQLPRQLTGEPDATRLGAIADQLTLVRHDLDALAPDLKTESEPRLQAFEKHWQVFLSQSAASVNTLFEQWINSGEIQSQELDYRSPVEKAVGQLNTMRDLMQKISDAENGFTNHLSLRSDLLQRSAMVRAKYAAYQRELQKIDQGMEMIRKARSAKEFSAGAALMASSEFSTSPAVQAASAVQSLNADEESTLRLLLNLTNGGTWAFVTNTRTGNFIPEIAMPAELQVFRQLNHDPTISATHEHYRFWLDKEGTKKEEWITVGPLDTTVGWKNIRAWTPGMGGGVVFENREYGFFDGQYKLSATQPVYRIESLGSINETASFYNVGLGNVLVGSDGYGKPLLEVLDALKDSRDGTPLFRAYLFLRLMDVMSFQPDAWGLPFCPTARAHAAQIRSIVGGDVLSGDWFLPGKASSLNPKLEEFFISVHSISYMKQANGLLTLARAASKNGLRFVGFVGTDGKLNLTDQTPTGEVWGYSINGDKPFIFATGNRAAQPSGEQPMRLSPLFGLDAPRMEYLSTAGVNSKDASFVGAVPPLFNQ